LVRPRLSQGAFWLAVTDGYERRCAVTGERTLPILDAAHIQAHDVLNGLLLRTDIHCLFDLGYVTVSPDSRFEVSRRLKADFDNGRHNYDLHGQPVRPPRRGTPPPSPEVLEWHCQPRFLG
jgi:putative restriction endonuclease